MIIIPHRKDKQRTPRPVTEIALLSYMGSDLAIYVAAENSII
jgi:hypothetical protein